MSTNDTVPVYSQDVTLAPGATDSLVLTFTPPDMGRYVVRGVGNELGNVILGSTNTYVDLATANKNYAGSALFGKAGDDSLVGSGGRDTLDGGEGADTLDGGAGADTMVGGNGEDVYVVDDVGDLVVEAHNTSYYTSPNYTGVDLVLSSVDYTLLPDVEHLTLTGGALRGTGNDMDNRIYAADNATLLEGKNGADLLKGGTGNDTLVGGLGWDTYILSGGHDVIVDIDSTTVSQLVLPDTVDLNALTYVRSGDDLLIGGVGGGDSLTTVQGYFRVGSPANGAPFSVQVGHLTRGGTVFEYYDSWWTIDAAHQVLFTQGNDVVDLTAGSPVNSGAVYANDGDDIVYGGNSDSYSRVIYGQGGNDTLHGWGYGRLIDGGEGNDVLAGAATLLGGLGNDQLVVDENTRQADGGEGADTYLIKSTYSASTVIISGPNGAGDRVKVLGPNAANPINPDQVTLSGNADGQITLRLDGVWAPVTLYVANNDSWVIEFNNGVSWTKADVQAILNRSSDGDDTMPGTAGDDTLNGGAGNDIIHGGPGNDLLIGGPGNDSLMGAAGDNTYQVGLSGNDTISSPYNYGPEAYAVLTGQDVLQFVDGITPSSITAAVSSPQTGSYSIQYLSDLDLSYQGGSVKLRQFFKEGTSDLSGLVDEFVFADGTRWSADRFIPLLRQGTAGNDRLVASANGSWLDSGLGHDEMLGNVGNDTLIGGLGNDTLWARGGSHQFLDGGDGNDELETWGSDDTVMGGEGRDYISASGERVLIGGGGGGDWIWAYGLSQVIDAGDGDDEVHANTGDDLLHGAAGNDWMDAGAGSDTLQGGVGDDTLVGNNGADTFLFNLGDGHDQVSVGATDTIVFGSGLQQSALIVERLAGGQAGERLLRFANVDDSVMLFRENAYDGSSVWQGVALRFADGTELSAAQVKNLVANAQLVQRGTEQRDDLTGLELNDSIYGLGGDDVLRGQLGDDLLDGGEGNDYLTGGEGNDVLMGMQGDDLLMGEEGNDTLVAGLGIDTLSGGAGADTFKVLRGDGDGGDIIDLIDRTELSDLSVPAERDVLWLADLNAADVNLHIDVSRGTLDVSLASGQSLVTVNNFLVSYTSSMLGVVEDIAFADGTRVSALSLVEAQLRPMTDGADTIYGEVTGSVLSGGLGDDAFIGSLGADTFFGGEGNDQFDGGYGDGNLLVGGAGNDNVLAIGSGDTVIGGAGNDTIFGGDPFSEPIRVLYDLGDGHDRLITYEGTDDTLVFGEGIQRSDIHAGVLTESDQEGILLTLGAKSGAISLFTVSFDNQGVAAGVNLSFADGSTMSAANVVALAKASKGVLLTGTAQADQLNGLQGADTLNGAAGNDVLTGGAGADTYLFAKGDGQDTVHADALDTIRLDKGMARADLLIGKLGATAANTVVLSFKGSTDTITLDNIDQLGGLQLSFSADGSSLSGAQVLAEATKPVDPPKPVDLTLNGTAGKDSLKGGAGNDTLNGLAGNDTLAGGLGNDKLIGGKGNDTYVFNRGDGKDIIVDTDSTWFNADLLKVGNAKSNQLWLTKSGNNLDIGIIGTQDHVVIQDWYKGSANQIEKITTLGDNKSLSASKVNALVTAMAKFSAPAEGVTTLPSSTQTALTKILASSWS